MKCYKARPWSAEANDHSSFMYYWNVLRGCSQLAPCIQLMLTSGLFEDEVLLVSVIAQMVGFAPIASSLFIFDTFAFIS